MLLIDRLVPVNLWYFDTFGKQIKRLFAEEVNVWDHCPDISTYIPFNGNYYTHNEITRHYDKAK